MLIWFLMKIPAEDSISIRYRNKDQRSLGIECAVSDVPIWYWFKRIICIDAIADENNFKWKVSIK